MGRARGGLKRKRAEKTVEPNGFLEGEESGDWWTDFSKRIPGHQSLSEEPAKFESFLKMSRKTFDYICTLVEGDMTKKQGKFTFLNDKPLTLHDQVAIALRRLSSGESLLGIGEALGINQSTVATITWHFVESMEARAMHHLQWPKTEAETTAIKSKFEQIRGLPNCCGAIDITHIVMCLPKTNPATEVWLDHGNKYSMVLQAVVDADMRFRDIVTGWPGKVRDSLVLESSSLFKLCEKGERLEQKDYIVGDSGFPSLRWLVTPYRKKELSEAESEFNKRHFATRMVASRALNRLKEVWGIIGGSMWRPDKHKLPRIILVCCLLHNIMIDMDDDIQDELSLSYEHDLGYQNQVSKLVNQEGSLARDELACNLSTKLGYQNQVSKLVNQEGSLARDELACNLSTKLGYQNQVSKLVNQEGSLARDELACNLSTKQQS